MDILRKTGFLLKIAGHFFIEYLENKKKYASYVFFNKESNGDIAFPHLNALSLNYLDL